MYLFQDDIFWHAYKERETSYLGSKRSELPTTTSSGLFLYLGYDNRALAMEQEESHGGVLGNKQEPVLTFLEMIENWQLPLYVMTEYNRVVAYSQQYVHKCLAKEGTNAETELYINSMEGDE